jgi:site-specific DNA-methyltransferase (adenine-specific)
MEIKLILKDEGSSFLNMVNRPKDHWLADDVAPTLRNDWKLQNTIYWIKSMTFDKKSIRNYLVMDSDNNTIGHFKPINSEVSK